MRYTLDHTDHDRIKELLIGHSITKISRDSARLDNGTVLHFNGNEGCACASGNYDVTELNGVENIITAVEFVEDPADDDTKGEGYKIFVIANDERLNFVSVDGTDGNGYYGTGYTIAVTSIN